MVERVARERDLAAVGGDLDDAPAGLGPEVRQYSPDQVGGAGQIGGDDVLDLLVGELFGGAEQSVAGVADDHVDASQVSKAAVDDVVDRRGVGHIEQLGSERVRVAFDEVDDRLGAPNGPDDAVSPLEQLCGELAAEAA